MDPSDSLHIVAVLPGPGAYSVLLLTAVLALCALPSPLWAGVLKEQDAEGRVLLLFSLHRDAIWDNGYREGVFSGAPEAFETYRDI